MRRSELLSPKQRLLEDIRKWVAFLGATIGASIFWATVLGGSIARHVFDASQETTLFYVAIPFAIILQIYFIISREKYFRVLGFDDAN